MLCRRSASDVCMCFADCTESEFSTSQPLLERGITPELPRNPDPFCTIPTFHLWPFSRRRNTFRQGLYKQQRCFGFFYHERAPSTLLRGHCIHLRRKGDPSSAIGGSGFQHGRAPQVTGLLVKKRWTMQKHPSWSGLAETRAPVRGQATLHSDA